MASIIWFTVNFCMTHRMDIGHRINWREKKNKKTEVVTQKLIQRKQHRYWAIFSRKCKQELSQKENYILPPVFMREMANVRNLFGQRIYKLPHSIRFPINYIAVQFIRATENRWMICMWLPISLNGQRVSNSIVYDQCWSHTWFATICHLNACFHYFFMPLASWMRSFFSLSPQIAEERRQTNTEERYKK